MGQRHSKRATHDSAQVKAQRGIPVAARAEAQSEAQREAHQAARQVKIDSVLYFPLADGEIRVLFLESGAFGTPLRGSFRHTTLPDVEGEDQEVGYDSDSVSSCGATRGFETSGAIQDEDNHNGRVLLDLASFSTLAYDAVSYAWGDPTYVHEMSINSSFSVGLTDSLYTALQHLRHPNETRNLWADAVCINQSDNSEKSAQVAIMARIYKYAAEVLVWLGEPVSSDALAYRAIETFSKRPFERLARKYNDWDKDDRDKFTKSLSRVREQIRLDPYCPCCKTEFDSEHEARIGRHIIPSISHLVGRPWFTRLWVVQEVVSRLRQTGVYICCGTHRASFSSLRDTIKQIQVILGEGQYRHIASSERSLFFSVISAVDDNVFGWEYDTSSSQLFWERYTGLIRRNCSNPRDRVYAIRSFTGIAHDRSLLPNYDLPVSEVYRRFALALMERRTFEHGDPPGEDKPWMVLSLAVAESPNAASFDKPSWVPDLHGLTATSVVAVNKRIGFGVGDEPFPADSRYFQTNAVSGSPGLHDIRGRVFTTIDWVASSTIYPQSDVKSDRWVEDLANWYRACREFTFPVLREYSLIHDAARKFHHLLASGSHIFKAKTPSLLSRELRHRLLQTWQTKVSDSENWDREGPELDLTDFAEDIAGRPAKHRSRALCRTRDMHSRDDFASIPITAQVGDHLCIFGGCPYPFVVRDNGDGTFRLIGDAYVLSTTFSQALGASGEGRRPLPEISAVDDSYFTTWEAAGEVEFKRAGNWMLERGCSKSEEVVVESLDTLDLWEQRRQRRSENGKRIMALGWIRLS